MSEKKKTAEEIVPVTDDILANLSIEELEERLEMQIIAVPNEDAVFGGCLCNNTGCYSLKPATTGD